MTSLLRSLPLRSSLLRSSLLFAAAGTLAAAPAIAAQSSAYAVSARLSADGQAAVTLPPQLATSGSTTLGQTYDAPLSKAYLSKSLNLLPVGYGPQLAVLEMKVATDASGISGIDAVDTHGVSTAAAGIVSLSGGALQPVSAPVPLRIQFSKMSAKADFSQRFPGPTQRTGATRFGMLSISGSLVGGKTLTFMGELKPNTVVLDTPKLKITLNEQIIPQNPVCEPGTICPLYRVLETVETQAVHVELTQAKVGSHTVSGDIVIGDAQAGQ